MRTLHFDYSNLSQICAERDLITNEIHATNDFYGHASILKRYAGLDEDYSLKGVVEHGINLDDKMWDNDRDAPLPVVFSPSSWRAPYHQQLSGKRTIPIGFGYLYAKALLDARAPYNEIPRGTLAFPCHSTHTILAKFDHEDYARRLAALPEWMQPVSVCMYWKNYLLGEHQPYRNQGLHVFSAGHMFDADFWLRFHDLARAHRFATSNEVGSHLFLSVSSGCRFVFTESKPITWEVPEEEAASCGMGNALFEVHRQRAKELFGTRISTESQSAVSQEQLAFVNQFIGAECQQSPLQLRKRIKQAESAYNLQKFKSWAARRWSKLGRIRQSVVKRLPWRKSA